MMPSRAWMSRISPSTSCRVPLISIRRNSLHSRQAAASAMRGCRTSIAGASARPAFSNSLSSSAYSRLDWCIALAVASSTRLTTNSLVRRMFFSECLSAPSLRGLMPTTQSGGSSEKTLKNENGAQLATPLALRVEIHAIGRGMTRPISSL